MYSLLRRLLFCLPPEWSHLLSLKVLALWFNPKRVGIARSKLATRQVTVFGIKFPNPIGLAAGFDKNGACIDALYGLGFGFVEVGAVTPRPQAGNPKPRVFRLPEAQALINSLGFNNDGIDKLVAKLSKRRVSGILGVNLGKNADTALDNAFDDYAICYKKLYTLVDFVTINISSPNTAQLRQLQNRGYLSVLLTQMKQLQRDLCQVHQRYVPILVKVSPDLNDNDIASIAEVFLETAIDGIVSVNTTVDRQAVQGLHHSSKKGGLSGRPLLQKACDSLKKFFAATQGKIPLIGVGGISSPTDAKMLLEAGASLVQLYTGLVYQGPTLIKKLVNELGEVN